MVLVVVPLLVPPLPPLLPLLLLPPPLLPLLLRLQYPLAPRSRSSLPAVCEDAFRPQYRRPLAALYASRSTTSTISPSARARSSAACLALPTTVCPAEVTTRASRSPGRSPACSASPPAMHDLTSAPLPLPLPLPLALPLPLPLPLPLALASAALAALAAGRAVSDGDEKLTPHLRLGLDLRIVSRTSLGPCAASSSGEEALLPSTCIFIAVRMRRQRACVCRRTSSEAMLAMSSVSQSAMFAQNETRLCCVPTLNPSG